MGRPKQHETAADRQQAYKARQQAAGKRQVGLWLSERAIKALDRKATTEGVDRGAIVERLLTTKK